MPLLNFQRRFIEPIRLGIKHHTIRADRKIPIKVGDKLYLYCGARTKNCFRILPEPQPCIKVQPIKLVVQSDDRAHAYIEGVELAADELERLAVADGFDSWREMALFWNGRYPFHGSIIHWVAPGGSVTGNDDNDRMDGRDLETLEEKVARYEATLKAISTCTLTGVDYGDWVQSVVDDALEGLYPECWNCGTYVHEGACPGEET